MRVIAEDTQPTRARAAATRRFRARAVHTSSRPRAATRRFRALTVRTPPRRRASRARWVWASVIAGAMLALPVVLLVGAYGWMRVSATVAPGVHVGDIPVGGMSLEQATEILDKHWNRELFMTAVDTGDAGRTWAVRPADFGLGVDAASTAEAAYSYARESSLPSAVWEMVSAFSNGWETVPIVSFDAQKARSGLKALSASAHIPASDARLGLAAGEITSTAAQWGRQLNVDSSLELIAADPAAVLLRYGFVPLVTSPVAPAIEEVAKAASQAEHMLSASPTLRAYDPVTDEWMEFTPSREQTSDWLRIQREGTGLKIEVEQEAITPYINSLQTELGEERTVDPEAATEALLAGLRGEEMLPLKIQYLPRYYVVTPQDTLISISFKVGIPYWKWLEGNPEVKARGLRVGESITIPPRDAMLELPVVESKRIIISISEQHMWLQENGETILEHIISTGIPNSPTMPGLFQIKSRFVNAYASNWDLYMPHFLGIYHATPNLLNGIHGLPLLSNGSRLWADVLGNPASYGCVILDLEAAEHLYTWAEDGVVVEIRA